MQILSSHLILFTIGPQQNVEDRYILKDNEELALNAKAILENKDVEIPFEVIAEIVYVLEKV